MRTICGKIKRKIFNKKKYRTKEDNNNVSSNVQLMHTYRVCVCQTLSGKEGKDTVIFIHFIFCFVRRYVLYERNKGKRKKIIKILISI